MVCMCIRYELKDTNYFSTYPNEFLRSTVSEELT